MNTREEGLKQPNHSDNPSEAAVKEHSEADSSAQHMLICPSCGASFDASEPKCPYCGRLNPEGAEDAYMEKLDDIREDLDELSHAPAQELGSEIKKHSRFLGKVFFRACIGVGLTALLLFLLFRCTDVSGSDTRARLLWEKENFPVMDELYESGEYEELYQFYIDAVSNDAEVWNYEHIYFIFVYDAIDYVKLLAEDADSGYEPDEYGLSYLLDCAMELYTIADNKSLSDEEKEILSELAAPYTEFLDETFPMDDATREKFTSQYLTDGYLDDDDADEYISSLVNK